VGLKDDIVLAAQAKKATAVMPFDSKTLNLRVYVKRMSGVERDEWEQEYMRRIDKSGKMNSVGLRPQLIQKCLCDEHGAQQFSPADATVINGFEADVVDELFKFCTDANQMSQEVVEECEKNCVSEAGSGSFSTSHLLSGARVENSYDALAMATN
jgi:hypothetical protein